jgi:hypothetical protein
MTVGSMQVFDDGGGGGNGKRKVKVDDDMSGGGKDMKIMKNDFWKRFGNNKKMCRA